VPGPFAELITHIAKSASPFATASRAAVPDENVLIFGFIASAIWSRSIKLAKYLPLALLPGSPEAINFAFINACFSP
jgi:hypothetical protein